MADEKNPLERWLERPGLFDEEELRRIERAVDSVTAIGARRVALLHVLLAFKRAQALGRIIERVMPLVEGVLAEREKFESLPYETRTRFALEYMRLVNQMGRDVPDSEEIAQMIEQAESLTARGLERVPPDVLARWRHVTMEILPALVGDGGGKE